MGRIPAPAEPPPSLMHITAGGGSSAGGSVPPLCPTGLRNLCEFFPTAQVTTCLCALGK